MRRYKRIAITSITLITPLPHDKTTNMNYTCKDCKFYLPVDVFRGICKLSKEKIFPDDPFCKKAGKQPKCKFCANYTAEKEHLGTCKGSVLAYPDMIALKCADFEWIQQN